MKRILLFAGTTEGRRLAEALSGRAELTVCVATAYGGDLLKGVAGARVVEGRMTREEMAGCMGEAVGLVVDATHPYAAEASRNIALAAGDAGLPLLRLARGSQDTPTNSICVPDTAAAVDYLSRMDGNILLTTGAKDLAAYTRIADYRTRLYVRVLPAVESLEACTGLGIPPTHIAAMQGPFTRELNIALMRQWSIETLVTKDGGSPGGFAEKAAAADALCVRMLVIQRPDTARGLSYEELLDATQRWLEETT